MGKAFGWLAALGLALGAAGGASAATLPLMPALPLSVDAMPSVSAPPPASFQLSGSQSTGIWDQPPDPATLMLLATGLGGLVALGHREFV
jgi:hypothetical protein